MRTDGLNRVDVGAATTAVVLDARLRVAEAVAGAITHLDDDGDRLDERQVAVLLEGLLSSFDGFERSTARTLVRDLREARVETWGLSDDLRDLVRVG